MYQPYNNRNIATLYIVRHGWVKPEYELTDNVYSYGKLLYKWMSARRKATAEIAGKTWGFQFESLWKTSLVITNETEEAIGRLKTKIFSRKAVLTMTDGFTATMRRTSFWKSNYVWENDTYGPIIQIKSPPFSSTDIITVEQSTAPIELVPLLAFLGIHLIIIRRQREAAAASH